MNVSYLIQKWYFLNKRELPWRDTSDPYKIWISEVILQQTKVNQGLGYYLRFIERFPTVYELVNADENEILKYWQGLGYYSRARNIQKASIQIVEDFGGVFPTEYSDIIKLAGVGEYTAAAIASFAYNKNYAVVDGNVYRVLSRFYGIDTAIDSSVGKKQFASIAKAILCVDEPGLHNQSMMEFGALQCVPSNPNCEICPLKEGCRAYILDSVEKFPVKIKKAKVTSRFFNYLFIVHNENTYLRKRVENDIWKSLYEFPLIESDRILTIDEIFQDETFKKLFRENNSLEVSSITNPMKHVLSHRVVYAQFVTLILNGIEIDDSNLIKIPIGKIDDYAVSRLMEMFLEEI